MSDKSRDKPLLVCVMGPTASGKTDLAVALAGHLDCELISVDSALVYRGLDIGAARPAFPHHLVDVRDPAEPYTAADFAADAARLVSEITGRGRVPVLVGGSMLYFRAYLDGLAPMPPADRAVRAQIEAEAAAHGWPSVHRQLAAVDPEAAARIHPNHSQRLSRALEVYRVSGVSLTDWHRAQRGAAASPGPGASHRVVQIAISPAERGVLHARIEQRFARMLDDGLLEEVRALWRRGDLHPDLPALRAVGYRQLWRYLEGRCELEEAVAGALAATRQLARRQLTWLRKWPDLKWIITDQAGNSTSSGGSESVAGGGPAGAPVAVALNYLHLASK